jgi:pyruvate carboxylase
MKYLAVVVGVILKITINGFPIIHHNQPRLYVRWSIQPDQQIQTSSEGWIQQNLESHFSPDNAVIRGPDQVLIYDTTLRGTC